jgi:hypothetical protein
MLDRLRAGILAWFLAGLLATGHARAADHTTEATQPLGATPVASARETGADVDAFLEPWRRVRVAHLIPDHARACVPVAGHPPATAAQKEIATGLDLISLSPLGAWLVERAASGTVLVCRDPNTHLAAYYRSQVRLIGLLARLPEPARIMFLAHELAHVPQHPRFSNDRRFGPQAMLLMHRMREAAAEAVATRVLWQLRERGYSEFLDYKLRSAYGDIASAFARTMAGGQGEIAELRATRAAFDQWFGRPQRLQQYDDHLLDHLERIQRSLPEPVAPSGPLSEGFLRGIGRHAGRTFLATGSGRPLTDRYYASGLSTDNAARLDALLNRAVRQLKESP